MPARVHALLVVRSDGDPWHLERTLRSLRAQERPPEALTIIVCGSASGELSDLIGESGAEGVISAARGASYADAIRLGAHRLDDAEAVWLLAQDTAAEPEALARLVGALERHASVAVAAPKLVEWNDAGRIVSLGVSMTRLGRAVELIDGPLDQGQYDLADDALAADVRGMLVRRDSWDALDGLDRALAGADEGLDLGVRARLSGARAVLVPGARVAVAGDGVAGLPAEPTPDARAERAGGAVRHNVYARRTAQLHRRLAYAPAAAVALHWLSIPVLAVLRTILHLARKAPTAVLGEWAASAVVWVRLGSVARSRRRIRTASRATGTRIPWSQLAQLRVTRAQLRRRLDGPEGGIDAPLVRGDLRFFTGGGAWTVLAALVVGMLAFVALLAWPTLGGGGLLPLHEGVVALWTDAAYGRRALGLDVVGPADPFAALIAVLGSLTFWNPSHLFVLIWVLALPLAALGGWFAATRLTERSGLRIAGAVLWTLAPTFLTALLQGRPAAVLAHLLLPWLFYTAVVARRSWAAAGAASILFAAVAACAPSLVPALLLLWLVLVVSAGITATRAAWIVVPAAALFAPLVWERGFGDGDWWGLLADPGAVFVAVQNGADAVGRALLAAGFPTPDLLGWSTLVELGGWAWVLCLPLGAVALLSLLTARWLAGTALVGVGVVGIATAIGVAQLAVQTNGSVVVLLWPGVALSLGWLGATGAALVALDGPLRAGAWGIAHRAERGEHEKGWHPAASWARGMRVARPLAAVVVVLAVGVLAFPALIAPARGETLLRNGPSSTLPAFVAAAGESDPNLGTLVLTPLEDGSLEARLVWGASETLGGQSTVISTRTQPTAGDRRIASLAADLVSPGAVDPSPQLAAEGIGFVLLRGTADADPLPLARQATAAMNARAALDTVGDTARGALWRVTGKIADRTPTSAQTAAIARSIALVQVAAFAIALLLAVPTAASRRAARTHHRVVGVRTERSAAPRRRAKRRAAVPDAAVPDAAVPDEGVPDEGEPDAGVPDEGEPGEAVPDETELDAAVPDTSRDGIHEAEDLIAPEYTGGETPDPWTDEPGGRA